VKKNHLIFVMPKPQKRDEAPNFEICFLGKPFFLDE